MNTNRTPGRFTDGAVWVPLLAVTDADDLSTGTVATALGIRGAAGGQPVVALQRALRDRGLLLVIDNCEHLASACSELLDALLPVCPQVSVLATSRRTLDSDLEVVFDLPALGVDLGGDGDAVALFIDRATIISPAYTLTEADSDAVHDICARLDGLPLAIELVASWIRVLSPRDLLATLGEGLTVVSSDTAPVEERHRSIQSVLDGTWNAGSPRTIAASLAASVPFVAASTVRRPKPWAGPPCRHCPY